MITTPIHRHDFDAPALLQVALDDQAQLEKMIAQRPLTLRTLSWLWPVAESTLNLTAVVTPESPKIRWAARVGAQAIAGLLTAGGETDQTLTLGDEEVTLPDKAPRRPPDPVAWSKAFYFAYMARDHRSLDTLCVIPPDRLRGSGVITDDFQFRWMAVLQALHHQPEELLDRLAEARRLFTPAHLKIASPESLPLDQAMFDLVCAIHGRDSEGLQSALHKALLAHQAYWSTPARADQYEGFVAWGPTALACLAQDRGLPIRVQSGYLPLTFTQGAGEPCQIPA